MSSSSPFFGRVGVALSSARTTFVQLSQPIYRLFFLFIREYTLAQTVNVIVPASVPARRPRVEKRHCRSVWPGGPRPLHPQALF
jgi:hypothetical protein